MASLGAAVIHYGWQVGLLVSVDSGAQAGCAGAIMMAVFSFADRLISRKLPM